MADFYFKNEQYSNASVYFEILNKAREDAFGPPGRNRAESPLDSRSTEWRINIPEKKGSKDKFKKSLEKVFADFDKENGIAQENATKFEIKFQKEDKGAALYAHINIDCSLVPALPETPRTKFDIQPNGFFVAQTTQSPVPVHIKNLPFTAPDTEFVSLFLKAVLKEKSVNTDNMAVTKGETITHFNTTKTVNFTIDNVDPTIIEHLKERVAPIAKINHPGINFTFEEGGDGKISLSINKELKEQDKVRMLQFHNTGKTIV